MRARRCAAARRDAQANLRLAEQRVIGCKADIAGHRQLAAATQAEAVDCGNDRTLEVLDLPANTVAVVAELLAFLNGQGGHFGNVRAGHERVDGLALLVYHGGTGQHDAVYVVHCRNFVERFLELAVHIGGQRVHGFHVLDLDDRYMAFLFNYYISHW